MAEEETRTAKGTPKEQLKVKDLLATHELYDMNVKEWKLLLSVYQGIRQIIANGYVERHEREPKEAYERRIKELFGLGYTRSIIEIFHFYLFKKPVMRKTGGLGKDELWKMFQDDADLFGNGVENVLMDIALYAAIQGHMGILVDKSSNVFPNRAEQIDQKVYPYIAKYHPSAVLDWEYERDYNNRPYLSMVKLLDDDEQYRIWRSDYWEVWELPKDKNGEPDDSNQEADAVFIKGGPNPLDQIPFLWHYNHKSKDIGIGVSDIHEVARIDLSIIRNLSQIEQIINFAAFPIMRKPMRDARPTDMNIPQQEDEVSVEAVLEFDPENPESKPDWLPSSAAEPIKATIELIEKKVQEIYRSSNAGGMAATEIQTQARSGVALKTEFQLLNAKLVSKAINLENTENKINELWLKWEKLLDKHEDEVESTRNRTYDVENLASDLENALTAKSVVISQTFDQLIQKNTARQMLPGATEEEIDKIDKEIEANTKEPSSQANTDNNQFLPNPEGGSAKQDQAFIKEASGPLAAVQGDEEEEAMEG
jgi:hypothetical protein